VEPENAVMAKTGQYQVFSTFFVALIIRDSLLGNASNNLLGIVLVILNCAIIALPCYFEINNYYEAKKMLKIDSKDAEGVDPPRVSDLSDCSISSRDRGDTMSDIEKNKSITIGANNYPESITNPMFKVGDVELQNIRTATSTTGTNQIIVSEMEAKDDIDSDDEY
jgi:hypothetical protein